jgi:hypothetical protein
LGAGAQVLNAPAGGFAARIDKLRRASRDRELAVSDELNLRVQMAVWASERGLT